MALDISSGPGVPVADPEPFPRPIPDRAELELIVRHAHGRALELGCYTGQATHALLAAGCDEIISVDQDETWTELCAARIQDPRVAFLHAPLAADGWYDIQQGDIVFRPDSVFDTIIASGPFPEEGAPPPPDPAPPSIQYGRGLTLSKVEGYLSDNPARVVFFTAGLDMPEGPKILDDWRRKHFVVPRIHRIHRTGRKIAVITPELTR